MCSEHAEGDCQCRKAMGPSTGHWAVFRRLGQKGYQQGLHLPHIPKKVTPKLPQNYSTIYLILPAFKGHL